MLKYFTVTLYVSILIACLLATSYALSVGAWIGVTCFSLTGIGIGFLIVKLLDDWDRLFNKEIK